MSRHETVLPREMTFICIVHTRVLKMPTKIFVGNIALETSRELLMPLFQRYGQVTECDVLGSYGFVVSVILEACSEIVSTEIIPSQTKLTSLA